MGSVRHIGTRHIHLDATDSTNNRAAELAQDPAYAGTVITADIQSQGRGQHGRVWHSPPGTNILLSTLLFPPPALQRPAILTAFASVVVAETILQVTGKQATIKWPNDVLIGGKKVCGILIESGVAVRAGSVSDGLRSTVAYASGSDAHFVIGIGLNVNQSLDDFKAMGLPDATSLSIVTGQKLDVKGIMNLLIDNLDVQYGHLLEEGITALEECWAWRLGKTGQPATIELMNANELRGRIRRLAFDALEIELSNGELCWLRPEEVRHLR